MKLPNGRLRPFKATYECNGITHTLEIMARSYEEAVVNISRLRV